MTLMKALRNAISIVTLNEDSISRVSKEKHAWIWGIVIVAISAWLTTLGDYLFQQNNPSPVIVDGIQYGVTSLTDVLFAPIGSIIGIAIGAAVVYLFVLAICCYCCRKMSSKGGEHGDTVVPVQNTDVEITQHNTVGGASDISTYKTNQV